MSMISRITLRVGQNDSDECDVRGNTNAAIQLAVERVAALGGGEVVVLPGVYDMHDSLHLRSHVYVCGSGNTTVLRKVPSVQSAIPAFLGYGHYDVSVAEPEKFKVGTGVLLHDDHSMGFYDTVATLTWQEGNRFGIDRMLNHDYHIANNATMTSVYPLISACNLTDAGVADLLIEGNSAENAHLNGCRGGGVYLLQAHDVTLRRITVHDFNGDGISFQQCVRTHIEECQLMDNTGHGLHPGSGSVAPIMRHCKCLNNGNDGIFYCLRVTYSLCEECDISHNGHDGISIGERDSHHLIRNNRISASGRYGVYFRESLPTYGGNDNVIEDNRIFANCRDEGDTEILVSQGIRRVQIVRNHFGPGNKPMVAVRVQEGCEEMVVAGNEADLVYRPTIQAANMAALSMQVPTVRLPVGPLYAPADSALHLNYHPVASR